jgi:hypothetical protein
MPRFMMFMYPQIPEEEYGPESASDADLAAMMAFNDEMTRAGVLLAGDGLHPASSGARVRATEDGKRSVTDGPFAEAKELVGGYWIIQARDRDEAVQWATRCPLGGDSFVEVRQIYSPEDWSEDQRAIVEGSESAKALSWE